MKDKGEQQSTQVAATIQFPMQTEKAAAATIQFPLQTENRNASNLSRSDDAILEAAREAWWILKKRTFQQWLAIADGVKLLRDRADRLKGRKTFQRLMEQEGFRIDGPKGERQFSKTTATLLEKIAEHRDAVIKWHDGLSPINQAQWASPSAIIRNCPIFAKPPPVEPKPPTELETLRTAHAVALEEIEQLKTSLNGGEHLFDPSKTPDRQIAIALVGRFSGWRGRARKIARLILELTDGEKRRRSEERKELDS